MKQITETIYEWLRIAGLKFGDVTKIPLAISLVQEEFDEMKEALEKNDREELLDSVADLEFVIHNVCYFYGLTAEEIEKKYNQVVASNYSKFCQTREEAQQAVVAYATGLHPSKPNENIATHVVETGNAEYPFVVKNLNSGKLLKSLSYLEPNKF
jgi:NTP pyrophosphatase (non-canonical NTP hydrolase)